MAVIANTSHSVTDFNDAPVVDIFLQNNESIVQIYNNDTESYVTDNWNDTSPLVLTPFVTVTGDPGNNVLDEQSTTDNFVARVQWYYVNAAGVRIRINSVTETGTPVTGMANTSADAGIVTGDFTVVDGGYRSDITERARTLTINRNVVGHAAGSSGETMILQSPGAIVGATVTIVCEIVLRDPTFGNITRERTITLQGNNQSGSAFLCILEQSNQFFSYTQTSDITLTGRLFLGGEELTDAVAANDPTPGDGWTFDIVGTSAMIPAGDLNARGNEATISPADVLGTQSYRIIARYEGVDHASNVVTIQDIADEWRMQGPAQVTLRNDQSAGQGNYTIYLNGIEYQAGSVETLVGAFVEVRKFSSTSMGETQTGWDATQTGTDRVDKSYITVAYADETVPGGGVVTNGLMTLTFGATVNSDMDPARFQITFQAGEIVTTATTITTIGLALDDGLG